MEIEEEFTETSAQTLKRIVEGALFAAGKPLSLEKLQHLFDEAEKPTPLILRETLEQLRQEYAGEDRAIELKEVASGYTFFVKQDLGEWLSRLWEEKPQKYTRALLETLVIIAYRQPVTRADIEQIRGVAVSTQIIKTLHERDWIRVVGHRDVLGKPSLYATTRDFLDYFGLKSLEELPPLSELKDLDQLALNIPVEQLATLEVEQDTETETASVSTEDPATSSDEIIEIVEYSEALEEVEYE